MNRDHDTALARAARQVIELLQPYRARLSAEDLRVLRQLLEDLVEVLARYETKE
jgi:hypothetical protein